MSSRAYAEYDPRIMGVRIAVNRRSGDGGPATILTWQQPAVAVADPQVEPIDDAWLRLPDDDARAIYEALADHYGHTGHDQRALRKDYERSEARVDRLIGHLIREQP